MKLVKRSLIVKMTGCNRDFSDSGNRTPFGQSSYSLIKSKFKKDQPDVFEILLR